MGLKKTITDTAYRLRIRKALSNATTEQIKITKEETIREIERRNKKNV